MRNQLLKRVGIKLISQIPMASEEFILIQQGFRTSGASSKNYRRRIQSSGKDRANRPMFKRTTENLNSNNSRNAPVYLSYSPRLSLKVDWMMTSSPYVESRVLSSFSKTGRSEASNNLSNNVETKLYSNKWLNLFLQ